jgi:hypothetical protein
MIIAGVLAAIFLVLWNSNRRGLHLILALACILSCGGFYFLERSIVTDGERLQAMTVQLCEDFRDKKPGVINYVSDTRPDLKLMFASAMAMVTVDKDLRLTDFQSKTTDGGAKGTVHFRANATISIVGAGNVGYQPARLILMFQREKGEWKIIGVTRLNPINGDEMEVLKQSAG